MKHLTTTYLTTIQNRNTRLIEQLKADLTNITAQLKLTPTAWRTWLNKPHAPTHEYYAWRAKATKAKTQKQQELSILQRAQNTIHKELTTRTHPHPHAPTQTQNLLQQATQHLQHILDGHPPNTQNIRTLLQQIQRTHTPKTPNES